METVKLSTVKQLVQDSNLPDEEKKKFVTAAEREAAIPDTKVIAWWWRSSAWQFSFHSCQSS